MMDQCKEEDRDRLLFSSSPEYSVLAEYTREIPEEPVRYAVTETGYYCIKVYNPKWDISSVALRYEFKNAYGKLPPEFKPIQNVSIETEYDKVYVVHSPDIGCICCQFRSLDESMH